MASRPKGYGLSAEMSRKIADKYDVQQEQEARVWMEAVVGEPLNSSVPSDEPLGMDRFQESLKDGQYLCRLIDAILGGGKIKFNTSKMAFKQMENIGKFLTACENFGVQKQDLFQTVDLYESQNMANVVNSIHALGRKAQTNGFAGPCLGPKESKSNVRDFTDEQLQAGKNVIGLQMGSNKGASQAGQNFGKTRQIMD